MADTPASRPGQEVTGSAPREDHPGKPPLTLHEAQAIVDRWISRFQEGYWPPLANLARLTEEVGELAREINHRHGSKPRKHDEPDTDLALEIADVLFVLIALANERGIDLERAFLRVMAKYEKRDGERFTPKQEAAEPRSHPLP